MPRRTQRRFSGALLVALLATLLAACGDNTAPAVSSVQPTARPAKPTKVPKPTATPKPKPAATAKPDQTTDHNGAAEWTILVYLDGDNNLESAAIDDFKEMASVGSTDQMNIIVELDRIKSDEDWDDGSNGNWGGTKRFRVEKQSKPTKANQLADIGEANMGDPKTLEDFATWGIETYPAQHYALIFWDHGASWPGIAADDTDDEDMLTLPELADALGAVQKTTGLGRFDLLGFDACLMSQIDVLQTVAPYGNIAVGSADLEPGEGWAWNSWLADLAKDPTQDAASAAQHIVKSFNAFYKKEKEGDVTLSAFDLRKVDDLSKRLDTLAEAMIDDMHGTYKAIGKARSYAVEYAAGDKDTSAIDLGYFAQSLLDNGAQGDVETAATALLDALKDARIAMGNGSEHPDGTGLSVYFPWKKRNYDKNYPESSPLTQTTRWNDFLTAFYGGGKTKATKSIVSQPVITKPSVAANDSVTVAADVSGKDTAYVSYFVGALDEQDPNVIQILYQDYVYPPGAVLGKPVPNWPAEATQARLTWNATGWYLTNGSDVVPVAINSNEYGTNRYILDGTYTAKKTGSQKSVRMEFEVAQGRGTLLRLLAVDTTNNKQQAREFKPVAGDIFTPNIPIYTDTGKDDLVEGTQPGTPITFGAEPFSAFEGPARNGSYLIGLLVENVAGDVTDAYADIDVKQSPSALPSPPLAQPAAESQPSAPSATAVYTNAELGFRITLPPGWEATETGSDKVMFEDKGEQSDAILAVDVYPLDQADARAAQTMLGDVLAEMAKEPGYTLRAKPAAMNIAGGTGRRAAYSIKDRDGTVLAFTTVTVAGADGKVYVLTLASLDASAAQANALLDPVIASFAFEK